MQRVSPCQTSCKRDSELAVIGGRGRLDDVWDGRPGGGVAYGDCESVGLLQVVRGGVRAETAAREREEGGESTHTHSFSMYILT